MLAEMDHVPLHSKYINTIQVYSRLPHSHLLFIAFQLSATPLMPSTTCKKNKAAHPGIPDMTPSQLSSAGLTRTPNARRPPTKKLTRVQQIEALEEELRATRELISSVVRLL